MHTVISDGVLSMSDHISASYETRKASPQTIADIFGSSWKAQLPGGLKSGSDLLFNDSRPSWFNSIVPGGILYKSVLELGPFEGYQTYLLDRLGASEIVSVEGNNINFLKCLCAKEILKIRASFKHGNIMEELREPGRTYDVLWASGVLYHMEDPIAFIEHACKTAPIIYIWTHFFDDDVMKSMLNENKTKFLPDFNRSVDYDGRRLLLHARTYGIKNYDENIPLYWEGAPQDLTYWLSLDDIRHIFLVNGFEIRHTEFIGDMQGVPVASFAAFRNHKQGLS